MRHYYYLIILGLFLSACTQIEVNQKGDKNAKTDVNALFEKNSETVRTYLQGYQDESLDYDALYSEDYVMRGTGQGSNDSMTAEQVKKQDKWFWATYDYKIVTDPVNLLPGVNQDTKLPDGSVRYYADWEVTLSATDSTESKSAILKIYESFDFDKDGKIVFQQYYGDFGGLRDVLHSKD